MKTLLAITSLFIVMSLLLVGCKTNIVETVTSIPTVDEIVESVVNYLKNITTLEFEANLKVDVTGEEDGETIDTSMSAKMAGMVDIASRDGKVDMNVTVESPGEAAIEADMEMYFIDDTMYTFMEIAALGNISMWVKTDVPPEMHGQMTQVEDQVDLLKLSKVKFTGTEVVAGKVCYVLELTPDPDALWEFISQRLDAAGAPLPGIEEGTVIREILRSYSMKQWIASDNFLLRKAEMNMEIEYEETIVDITMSLMVGDYNQPVDIELPEEAGNAIEIPSSQLFGQH